MTDPTHVFDETRLREAMNRRLLRRSIVSGQIRLPAVPGMIDEYVAMCETIFAGVGRKFTPEQMTRVRSVLESQLARAYEASQRSEIVIAFDAPVGPVLNYNVRPHWLTIDAIYDNWVATRTPPLFGTEPDARVWALANEATDPSGCRVLDIGAGTGRNALALARRGHPVEVVEITPKFADIIQAESDRESLGVRVIQRDVFTTTADLRNDYQLIVLSEVVAEFRTPADLRKMFELAHNHLAPGGRLVFNSFLAHHGYVPDDAARGMAEQMYSNFFTWDEMTDAAEGLSLELISDDAAFDYEKEHLPEGVWPQTSWYAGWAAGQDIFDLPREECPVELRWLVYRKQP